MRWWVQHLLRANAFSSASLKELFDSGTDVEKSPLPAKKSDSIFTLLKENTKEFVTSGRYLGKDSMNLFLTC